MDMMEGIAAMSMDMKAAQLSQNVSVSLLKKAMETEEIALEEITEMASPAVSVPKGEYIDVYA